MFKIFGKRSKWLLEGFIGIFPALSFIVVLLIGIMIFRSPIVISGCRERDIRILGMVLQLLGFCGVAYGLRQASSIFRVPSLKIKIIEYFKRFPLPKNQTVHLRGVNVTSRAEVSSGGMFQTAGPNATLKYRVGLLEIQSKDQNKRVGEIVKKLHKAENELKKEIELEKIERKSGDMEASKVMSEMAVGGIHIEWYALISFVIGIILASASPEISSFFGHISSCIN